MATSIRACSGVGMGGVVGVAGVVDADGGDTAEGTTGADAETEAGGDGEAGAGEGDKAGDSTSATTRETPGIGSRSLCSNHQAAPTPVPNSSKPPRVAP